MTETTTKEDSNPKRWRRQSSDKEYDDKYAVTKGVTAISESGDGYDGKEGSNAGDEVNNQGRWKYRAPKRKSADKEYYDEGR